MKKLTTLLLALILLLAAALALAACGNRLGIPDGDYVSCDEQGSIIEETQGVLRFSIKGTTVTDNNFFAGNRFEFNSDGKIKNDSKYGDFFQFKYKQIHDLFGPVSAYYNVTVSYDKDTKILKAEERYYTKIADGAFGPVIPPGPPVQ